jgi:hypothetical protein
MRAKEGARRYYHCCRVLSTSAAFAFKTTAFQQLDTSCVSSFHQLIYRASCLLYNPYSEQLFESSPTGRQPLDSSMPPIKTDPLQQISDTKLLPRPFHRGSRGPYFDIPDRGFRDPTKFGGLFATVEASSTEKAYAKQQSEWNALRVRAAIDSPWTDLPLSVLMGRIARKVQTTAPRPQQPHRKWIMPKDTLEQARAIDAARIDLPESLLVGKIIRKAQPTTPQPQQPSREWTSPQETLKSARARDSRGTDFRESVLGGWAERKRQRTAPQPQRPLRKWTSPQDTLKRVRQQFPELNFINFGQ